MRCNRHTARVLRHGRAQLHDRDRIHLNSWNRDSWQACKPPALADGLFNAADPKPNADFIFVRLFRVDRVDQTQSNKQGEALLVFKDEGVGS